MGHGGFSPYPYIAVVVAVIVVNIFLLVRFLIKASKWGAAPRDDKEISPK
ncbi:MAG: hypothetical protein HY280_05685 [Nitrospinae bacterium]|nr:hypothetical protein [Nitrospinota bacterium]